MHLLAHPLPPPTADPPDPAAEIARLTSLGDRAYRRSCDLSLAAWHTPGPASYRRYRRAAQAAHDVAEHAYQARRALELELAEAAA